MRNMMNAKGIEGPFGTVYAGYQKNLLAGESGGCEETSAEQKGWVVGMWELSMLA